MIKEFKTEEARNKHVLESKNKLKNMNKKWKKSLERMKEDKERSLSAERDKVMEKMEKRKDGASKKNQRGKREKTAIYN